jgi:hypothetical protein
VRGKGNRHYPAIRMVRALEAWMIPRHLRSRKATMDEKKILVGRPRLSVDFAIVLRLREVENLGWSRMAQTYREMTGQYISRETIKRRYLEAKAREDMRASVGINDHESIP